MSPQAIGWIIKGVIAIGGALILGLAAEKVKDWIQAPIKEQLAQEKQAHAETKASKARCDGVVTAQTQGIDALKAESDKRVAESKAALAEAKKQADKHRQTALDILSAKPEVPGDLCESARRVLVK